MSYKVLSRKWRPSSFTDLKGQESIRTTLTNAVKNDRLHHALLFSGPRGTGKTSSARIIAKILRCTNLGKDFSPCNTCKDCEEVSQSRNLDVLEIDGASNNGVDSIRELRDQVNFNPTSGKNKIYIIDEVHMLSTSAFNALLKTLEEPPDNVYFMMATTEPHKIPKTILSRCQRFDFRPVPLDQVVSLLQQICQDEGLEYEDEALFLIAQTGGGCVRDSLSFLDQAITFSSGTLTFTEVSKNIGVTGVSSYKSLLTSLINRESDELISELIKLRETHIEPQIFLEEIVVYIKNLILFKVDLEQVKSLQDFTETQKLIYEELSLKASLEDLYILFDICFQGTLDMSRAFSPSAVLEVTLLKAGTSPFYRDLKGAQAPSYSHESAPKKLISDGTKNVAAVTLNTKSSASVASPSQVPVNEAPHPEELNAKVPNVEASHAEESHAQEKKPLGGWMGFVKKVNTLNPIIGAKLEACSYSYDSTDKKLYIKASDKIKFMESDLKSEKFLSKVQNYLNSLWQEGIVISYAIDTASISSESGSENTTEGEAESQTSGVRSSNETLELKKSVNEQESEDKRNRLAKLEQEVENHDVVKNLINSRGGRVLRVDELSKE